MQKPTFKNKKHIRKQAFTLIELLIVIAIIGILFIVLVSKVDFATDKAKATGVQTDFRSFQLAFETVSRENAGFNTFGWDTGDINANGKRDSYDEGDANKNGIRDAGEIWTGHKVYDETFTKVFTLVKPGTDFATVGYDSSAIAKLETAINANLDPKLHVTINHMTGKITMANGAQDPWNKEYHGWYITNAENDKQDRGAIIMYSDGTNNEFGSEHKIYNGVVTVTIPNSNKHGKDDYALAVVYSYNNGYGEVKNKTWGFSINQDSFDGNVPSNNVNNGGGDSQPGNGFDEGDETPDVLTWNVPFYEPVFLKDSFTTAELKMLFENSTERYDDDYVSYLLSGRQYIDVAYLNENSYALFFESVDGYGVYVTEESVNGQWDYWDWQVESNYTEPGFYALEWNDATGMDYLVPMDNPRFVLTERDDVFYPNGIKDLSFIFKQHSHSYTNCLCACGMSNHTYNSMDTCTSCGHFGPGLYLSDTKYRVLLYTNDELINMGAIDINGMSTYWELNGDLWMYAENGIIPEDTLSYTYGVTGIKLAYNTTKISDWALANCYDLSTIEFNENLEYIGSYVFYGGTVSSKSHFYYVYWPSNINTIQSHAFRYVIIDNFYLGSNVTNIEDLAFYYTDVINLHIESLESWYAINFTTSVMSTPLTGASENVYVNGVLMTDLIIDESITSISANKFYGFATSGGKLMFNSHITFDDIGVGAFSYMKGIETIIFNDAMTYLPEGAFSGCLGLTEVVIPKNITTIESGVFAGCEDLITIRYEGTVDEWNAMNISETWCHSYRGTKLIPATDVICSDGTVWISTPK